MNEPRTKVGAPKKREKVVSNIAEAMGVQLSADVLTLEELKDFPDITKESPRNQVIMAAVACGISQTFIAKAMGVAQPTINEIIQRIDPNRMFKLSASGKRAFMTQLYTSRGMEALISITPEKLEESSAVELGRIAKTMGDAAQALNTSKHKQLGTSALDRMLQMMDEADVEETPCEKAN